MGRQAENALKKPILALQNHCKSIEKALKTRLILLMQEEKGNVRVLLWKPDCPPNHPMVEYDCPFFFIAILYEVI